MWIGRILTELLNANLRSSVHVSQFDLLLLQLLKRFPSDTQLPVRIVEKLLATSVDDNLEVALDICADVAEAAELAHEHGKPVDAKAMSALHALLWNRGASIFSSKKDYKTSLSLFESALLFLSPDNKNRGKSMRVLALCHMGLQEFDRALEYLTQADKVRRRPFALKISRFFQQYSSRMQGRERFQTLLMQM